MDEGFAWDGGGGWWREVGMGGWTAAVRIFEEEAACSLVPSPLGSRTVSQDSPPRMLVCRPRKVAR